MKTYTVFLDRVYAKDKNLPPCEPTAGCKVKAQGRAEAAHLAWAKYGEEWLKLIDLNANSLGLVISLNVGIARSPTDMAGRNPTIQVASYGPTYLGKLIHRRKLADDLRAISAQNGGGTDCEAIHGAMDDRLVAELRSLGYGEAMDVYDKEEKWYA